MHVIKLDGNRLFALASVLLVGACAESSVLPPVDSVADAYAQQVGADSLKITIVNSQHRELAIHLCTTKLQVADNETWIDVEGTGPSDCIAGLSEPIVPAGANRSFTIAYRFGLSAGTRRVVISALLTGTPDNPRNINETDDVLTSFPLGQQP